MPLILLSVLTVIQLKRLKRKILWIYSDWLSISSIMSSLIAFMFMKWDIILSLIQSKKLDNYRWISFYWLWVFMKIFELLIMYYPVLLVIYYTKLGGLQNNRTFREVKKSINRLELWGILLLSFLFLPYLMIGIVPHVLYRIWQKLRVLFKQEPKL